MAKMYALLGAAGFVLGAQLVTHGLHNKQRMHMLTRWPSFTHVPLQTCCSGCRAAQTCLQHHSPRRHLRRSIACASMRSVPCPTRNAAQALVRSLEAALASPSIPADLVTSLLNLAEFMEHDDKSLPLDIRCVQAVH